MIAPLHYLSISDAATLIRAGDLSPVALTRDCLARINAIDSRLHAFITVTAEHALADAEAAEREMRSGHYRGPLHGIPVALKDIVHTAGIRTTAHSRLLADFVPPDDAAVYEKLRATSVVLMGKTSLHEFAYGNPVNDELFPSARNPWNSEYSPGRSSSGSGAAVASGMCLGAIGTDTGGSIRHPAAVCGIVGMKPTFGRVSCYGVIPLAAPYDHVGPMTRTVRDNALLLQAIAGYDARDRLAVAHPVPDFSSEIGRDLRGVRVGIPRRFLEALPVEATVARAFDEALKILSSDGAAIVNIEVDGLVHAIQSGAMLVMSEAYRYHYGNLMSHPEQYGRAFRERVLKAGAFTNEQLAKASAVRSRLCDEFKAIFAEGIDIVASPTKEVDAEAMQSLYEDPVDTRPGTIRIHNMTGAPALSVPMGFGDLGVPVGMQLAAAHWCEPMLYRVAAAYESVTPWVNRHPEME